MRADADFDTEALFDEDYLYFYAELLTDERSDAEADVIWRAGDVRDGDAVLDLACGHGRIANRLAARGARVVGVDATPLFLERARNDAQARGVSVDYRQGDMRELSYENEFDVVVFWFTAFGYFGDDIDRDVLRRICRALRPGGRLLMELNHGPVLMRGYLPAITMRRGDDVCVDEHSFDPVTARIHTARTVVRDGRSRSFRFSVRLFAFPELRDWLLAAGFTRVDAFSGDGQTLDENSRRMVVRATRE